MSTLTGLTNSLPDMLESLRLLVEAESPSSDAAATSACAKLVSQLGERLLGTGPEWLLVDGRVHLRWSFGERVRVLLLGHFDTVWPLGTLDRWSFGVQGDRATGPGAFDMKAGIVQGLFALAACGDPSGVRILLTSDEETGSHSSEELIQDAARDVGAVLVLEPSAAGALKTARKGVGGFRLRVHGRASHAGLDPEAGINALVELAHHVLEIQALASPEQGTTVVPTLASAGTTDNTVPAEAQVDINARAWTMDELRRVQNSLRHLTPLERGARLDVEVRHLRPPLEASASARLFELANSLAAELGLEGLDGVAVGGGSDGNITAALGIQTLDGLGAVGDGAHAEGEHVLVSKMPERAALVAALIQAIRS